MMKKPWRQNFQLLAALGTYTLVNLYVYERSGIFIHRATVRGMFLALLPYLFMILSFAAQQRRHHLGTLVASLCWPLLSPDVPYLTTNFIYISPLTFYIFRGIGSVYARELLPWPELLHLAVGILFGIMSGHRSLYLLYEFATERLGQPRVRLFIALIYLLSSYGVYLGQPLRLSSWDITRPSLLIEKIVQGSGTPSLQFALAFFLFLFTTYSLCYFRLHREIGGTRHEDTLRQ